MTLTYDDKHLPDRRDRAVRKMRSFLSKLRQSRKARGQPLSHTYVIEGCYPGGRLRHHLVINSAGEDLEKLWRLWIYGPNVEMRRLRRSSCTGGSDGYGEFAWIKYLLPPQLQETESVAFLFFAVSGVSIFSCVSHRKGRKKVTNAWYNASN